MPLADPSSRRAAPRPIPVQQTGGPALAIVPTRRVGVAPAGIGFTATATGWEVDIPSEDLRYEWDFGDAQAPDFAYVPRIGTVWGASANRAFGDRAAHVFHPSAAEFAGARARRFTVRCTATDGARAVTAEIQVEIENPDHVFAGARTVLVAPDGDFSGAPEPVTGEAFARAREFQGRTGERRILFKRGHRYEMEANIALDGTGRAAQVGAWGTGAAPVLSGRGATGNDWILRCRKTGDADQIAIWGLTCESTWDAATETAAGGVFPWTGLNLGGGVSGHVTLQGCRFSGFSNTISTRSGSLRLVVADTEVTNWRDYGILAGDQGVLALVGCRVEQDADAMGGAAVPQAIRGGPNLQNDHGPVRVGRAAEGTWTLISQTQMRSVNGWSPGNAGRGVPNRPSHQPCLRWNTRAARGGVLRLDRVVAEGGNPAIGNGTFRNKEPDKRCDILLDKLITIGTSNNGGTAWGTEFTDAVCRNFLVIVPPTAGGDWELLPPGALMGYGGGRRSVYSADALEGRIHVYSGTVLDWTRVDKELLADRMPESARMRHVIVSNVLHHAPFYAQDPRDLSAALELVALFAPSYRGLKWQNRHKDGGPTFVMPGGEDTGKKNTLRDTPDSAVLDAAYASVAELPGGTPTVALPFPAQGAPAATFGPDARVALDDLLGRLRGPMPHAGALEPR